MNITSSLSFSLSFSDYFTPAHAHTHRCTHRCTHADTHTRRHTHTHADTRTRTQCPSKTCKGKPGLMLSAALSDSKSIVLSRWLRLAGGRERGGAKPLRVRMGRSINCNGMAICYNLTDIAYFLLQPKQKDRKRNVAITYFGWGTNDSWHQQKLVYDRYCCISLHRPLQL